MSQPFLWWKLYYADGSVFTSRDGSWLSAPAESAIIFRAARPDGTFFMQCGRDALWWDGVSDFVYNLDLPEPFQYIAGQEAVRGRLKRGVEVPNWGALYDAAISDFTAP